MSPLERESVAACAAALSPYGFVPKRSGFLQERLRDQEIFGWIGLNIASIGLPKTLLINPVIGVRSVDLEKSFVELAGWKAPVPIVTKPLGYLMPSQSFRQWEFDAGADLSAPAEDLAAAVNIFGQPFIEKWSSPATLVDELDSSELLLAVKRWITVPIVHAVYGDKEIGRQLVEQEVIRVQGKEDLYSKNYMGFAERFFARYSLD